MANGDLPWWFFAVMGYVLLNLSELQVVRFLESPSIVPHDGNLRSSAQARHLAAQAAPPAAAGESGPAEVNFTVPCVDLWKPLIVPCGNLTITESQGADVSTPFGIYSIPKLKDLEEEVEKDLEPAFTQYTVYFVAILVFLWFCKTCCISSNRKKCCKSLTDIAAGKMGEESDSEDDRDDAEKEEELKDRMDPKSADFIAPGNIYRLLAVMHPGIVGFKQWGAWASKALICAYMQIYLPTKIIKRVFMDWEFNGIKSPLWFVQNMFTFVTMFTALASLCNLFAGKCSTNILNGAEANFFILTHKEPDSAREARHKSSDDSSGGYMSLLNKPKCPDWAISLNETFWCALSMVMNVSMSMLLQICMFLKVATFADTMEHVALVAVSLYFVFDLDDKVMDADPKLKPLYRRNVLRQTEEREGKPKWVNRLAGTAVLLLKSSVPVGLLFIILSGWKSKTSSVIIGGDGMRSH